MLGAGALGRPRGMVQGGRREEGSGWGTHVCLWRIHFDIWQNQYNIVKFKNKIKLKKIYFCFVDYAKAFEYVDHNKLENSSSDGNTRPPDLPLKKPVCRSGSNIRTGHGTTDWFPIGKGIHQRCILSPCLFKLYA